MTWNHLSLEVIPEDALIRPLVGPGGMTEEEARTHVGDILDRLAARQPAFRKLVSLWAAGEDTVYAGPFTWAVYEHDDPAQGAREWIDGYAATLRSAGMEVAVAW